MNAPVTDWRRRRVWIVGASSGIGAALANALIARGARVALSARRSEPLEAMAARAPLGQVRVVPLDVTDPADWVTATDHLRHAWDAIDLVVFMAANFRAMRAWSLDPGAADTMIATNFGGIVQGLAAVIPMLEEQGGGGIVLVASVAGYGGLPKALIYGATKAALIHLAEGLYLDLAPRGISVYLVNPGFVRTPLTAANDFYMPALLEPDEAATAIVHGIERGGFEIRFPRRLAWPLALLRLLPYRFYFPLVQRMTRS